MHMSDLQELCEIGQQQLMATDYLVAEQTLVQAEAKALASRDWDTLARLYMPLQEARRQRRQRCGEGTVRLDIIAPDASAKLDPEYLVGQYPQGQLLVAGWASIAPAIEVRRLQAARGLYVETFLAASYVVDDARIVAILPREDSLLPPPDPPSVDELIRALPPHSIVIPETELPTGETPGTPQTYARVMAMWERLHAPYLALADATTDPFQRIAAYRRAIDVDYACELAHQKLSDVARTLKAR